VTKAAGLSAAAEGESGTAVCLESVSLPLPPFICISPLFPQFPFFRADLGIIFGEKRWGGVVG
jgi:hypothetical protein